MVARESSLCAGAIIITIAGHSLTTRATSGPLTPRSEPHGAHAMRFLQVGLLLVRVSFSKAEPDHPPPASHTAGKAPHDIREANGSSLRDVIGPEVARVVSEWPAMVIMLEPTHRDDHHGIGGGPRAASGP